MKREFMIGEVAELLGISKDTLRIYEEKGLVVPRRDENDFRRYSEDDLYRLIPIMFYRGSSLTMKEVGVLMQMSGADAKRQLILRQIGTEERALQEHRRNLSRLKVALAYYNWDDMDSDRYELTSMPVFYIVSEKHQEMTDTVQDWFRLRQYDKDLALSYLNGEYDLRKSLKTPKSCYLILAKDEISYVKETEMGFQRETIGGMQALHTIVIVRGPLPEQGHIEALVKRAKQMGVVLAGQLYAHFLWSYEENGEIVYAIQMYAPIEEQSKTMENRGHKEIR